MSPPRLRRFLVAAVAFALSVTALSLAYRSFGRDALGPELVRRADRVHEMVVVGSACVLVLAVLVHAFRRSGLRWPWLFPVLSLYYVGVELIAAPHLERSLELRSYFRVRDPDHRPSGPNRRAGLNSDGVRSEREASEFEPSGVNIVFLGDSFTYGLYLEPDEAFPARVEHHLAGESPGLDVRVANFGWRSSSPLLSHRRLVDIGEEYHPDIVALCVDMTDFRDDILWDNMLERRGIYFLYDRIPLALKTVEVLLPTVHQHLYRWSGIDMPRRRFFVSDQPLEESRPHMQPLANNVERIHAWCAEHGARFVVFVLPRTYQYSDRESPGNWEADQYEPLGPYSLEPFRFFEELSAVADYPIHSLLETFQTTDVFPTAFEDDPHWNAAGADVAAREIARLLSVEIDALSSDGR